MADFVHTLSNSVMRCRVAASNKARPYRWRMESFKQSTRYEDLLIRFANSIISIRSNK